MAQYTNAQWIDLGEQHIGIRVDIDGVPSTVPLDPANSDYAAIMKLVGEGKLVIAPATAETE
jgi:hypothetical protein